MPAASCGQACAAIAEVHKARCPEPARRTIFVALPAAEPTADAIAIAPAATTLIADAARAADVPSASTQAQVVASWGSEDATWHVEGASSASDDATPEPIVLRVPEHPRVAPVSAAEFLIPMPVDRASRDLLRESQDLLAHAMAELDRLLATTAPSAAAGQP